MLIRAGSKLLSRLLSWMVTPEQRSMFNFGLTSTRWNSMSSANREENFRKPLLTHLVVGRLSSSWESSWRRTCCPPPSFLLQGRPGDDLLKRNHTVPHALAILLILQHTKGEGTLYGLGTGLWDVNSGAQSNGLAIPGMQVP